jgi:hypothetical protein
MPIASAEQSSPTKPERRRTGIGFSWLSRWVLPALPSSRLTSLAGRAKRACAPHWRPDRAKRIGESLSPPPLPLGLTDLLQLGQIADRIAISASQGMRHTSAGPSEASGLGTEIDSLRAALADLTAERARVGAESDKLRSDLSRAEASLGPLLQSSVKEQQEVAGSPPRSYPSPPCSWRLCGRRMLASTRISNPFSSSSPSSTPFL